MRLLGQLATWAATVVVIRLLNPADYGLMGLASVFVSFLVMINTGGFGVTITQRRHIADDDLRALYGFVLLTSAAFCLVLLTAAPFIAGFYQETKLTGLIRLLCVAFFLMGMTVIPSALMLRDMEYRKIAIIDFISAIIGSISTLLLA